MLFLGIDMGTSYFKAALFNEKGALKGLGKQKVPTLVKGKNVTLQVSDFWNCISDCLDTALQQAAATIKDICAVGYSSQANTFILLDENDTPLTPLIFWTDAGAETDEALQAFTQKQDWQNKTGIGIPFNHQFFINKCRWIQKQQPELWDKTDKVLTLAEYLTYSLTGQRLADNSTTSLTGLLDIEKNDWWNDALHASGISRNQLSPVVNWGDFKLKIKDNNPLQLESKTLLYGGGLDHHLAAIGAGIGLHTSFTESTGTVIAAVFYTNDATRINDVCAASGFEPGTYFKMTFDINGAAALEWYQENFANTCTLDELTFLAEKVNGTDGMIALPAANTYTGKNGFLNVRDHHHHGHYVRAIMESTAQSLNGLIKKLDQSGHANIIYSTGGGAKNVLWKQIKEQVTGRKFYRYENNESACKGAALLAAVGAGLFSSVTEAQQQWLPVEQV